MNSAENRFFDIVTKPRIEGSMGLYQNNNCDFSETYFNYIPLRKIKKYTDIYEVTVKDNSVMVKSSTVREINCAIIICTYNREQYVKKNVEYLSAKIKSQNDFKCEIIVVDNAHSLQQKDFGDRARIIHNNNSGGSGGFKRGMQEVARLGGFTHYIVMDDDIEIDFVAVQKCLNFLRFTKEEYQDICINGSMLYINKPTYQFEAGGRFGSDGTQKGFGHYLDLSVKDNLIVNEQDNPINYGGFWFMCMPVKYIQQGKYPMPFFLKYDDIEYALRCNLQIITLNGVGVWHAPFEWKYNSAAEYYNTRNYLFLCEMYCNDTVRKNIGKFVKKQLMAKVKRQQYRMAEAVLLGYRDFCKGMEYLKNLDPEKKHNEICSLNYNFVSYDEITAKTGVELEKGRYICAYSKRNVLKMFIPKKYAVTDHFFDRPLQYIFSVGAVHCNPNTNTAYVTRRSLKKAIRFWMRKIR